jgi:hypothetical protein
MLAGLIFEHPFDPTDDSHLIQNKFQFIRLPILNPGF